MNSPPEAKAFLEARIASDARYAPGNCLGAMRDAYGSPAVGGTAATAYAATKERGTGPAPFGALLWWLGGSTGAGHTTFSLGDGTCITTDFADTGYIGDGRERRVTDSNISLHDPALKFQGWSKDLDGFNLLEVLMILVQKQDGGPIYHYTGNHIEALTDHMTLRALGLGAKKVILNDTDEIFSLGPPTATGTSTPHAHTHPLSATTGVGA